jgi:hypothetical protein
MTKSWSFWMPATLEKSASRAAPSLAKISGIASLESPDHADEEVLQEGLDWSYWLQHGFFKWNHGTPDRPSLPEEFVGVGTLAERREVDGVAMTFVEGNLFDTPMAQQVVDLARALEKEGRHLGLSVEGGILVRQERDGKTLTLDRDGVWRDEQGVAGQGARIARAVVVDVTITAHPMHPEARMSLARSLLSALDAGHPAPADSPGAGGPLLPQSIEQETKKAVEPVPPGEPPAAGRMLSHDEACLAVLKRYPHMPYSEAERLVQTIREELFRSCAEQREGRTDEHDR